MSPRPRHSARTSLYDIAPRLAVARDQRKWEIACIDGSNFSVGDEFAKIVYARHEVQRCPHCGGAYDVHHLRRRLLVGCNKGYVTTDINRTCRRCGNGHSSHW